MNSLKIIFTIFSLCFLSLGLSAQDENVEEKERRFWAKPEKYNLTFRLDYGRFELFNDHKYTYEGEYENTFDSEIGWTTIDGTLINFDNVSDNVNLKFDLMVSTVEPLSFGLTYHLQSYKSQLTSGGNFNGFYYDIFLGLGAVVDYRLKVKAVKGLVINPAISLGYYIASEDFSGKGKERYANFKLASVYNLIDKIDIRLYTDFTRWRYKEDLPSVVFPERNRVIKSHINHMNIGIGLAYRFHLVPD